MSLFHEKIKEILFDVQKFLSEIIPADSLIIDANECRLKLLNTIDKLLAEYPSLKCENSSIIKPSQRNLSQYKSTDTLAEENYQKFQKAVPAANLKNSEISGYLYKCRRPENLFSKLGPQKRWCAVKGVTFFYYNKPTDLKQRCCFSLTDYKAQCIEEKKHNKYYFVLLSEKHRSYKFNTNTPGDRDAWIRAINEITNNLNDTTDSNGNSFKHNGGSMTQDEQEGEYNDPANIREFSRPAFERQESQAHYEDPELEEEMELSNELYENTDSNELYENTDFVKEKQKNEASRKQSSSSVIYEDVEYVNVTTNRQNGVILEYHDTKTISECSFRSEELSSEYDDTITTTYSDVQIDYDKLYYARWSRSSCYDDEINLMSGDIVCVYDKFSDDEGWWTVYKGSQMGIAPKNYLMPVYKQTPY